MTTLLLLLLSIVPAEDVARETVDFVEVNWFYDEQGRLVFQQAIFLDWNPDYCCEDVRASRLIKSPGQVPRFDRVHGCYVATWQDGELLRSVRAKAMRETWTQEGVAGDPELNAREVLPKEHRRELRAVKVKH